MHPSAHPCNKVAQLHTLFALANLVIVKKALLVQQYRA
jgi:hypothetical protein